jgi:preprotein translocase SecE subunit
MAFITNKTLSFSISKDKIFTNTFSKKVKLHGFKKKNSFNFSKNENSEENKEYVKERNENMFSFLKEIATEMKMIEWPSLDRLFKQFVIVVLSLVFSAIFIYSVDGVFSSLSKFFFEGN